MWCGRGQISSFRGKAKRVTDLASVLTEEEQSQLSDLLKKLGIGLKDKQ